MPRREAGTARMLLMAALLLCAAPFLRAVLWLSVEGDEHGGR